MARLPFPKAALLALVLGMAPYAAPSPRLALAQLKTNAATEPLGIDDRTPRFRWQLVGEARGIRQTALHVFVA